MAWEKIKQFLEQRMQENGSHSGVIGTRNGITYVEYDVAQTELRENEIDVLQMIDFHRRKNGDVK
jgi:hypothetical protein